MAKWTVGADRNLPIAQTDRPWDGAAAKQRIFAWAGWPDNPQSERARRAFLVYDAENPENKGSYKLPFADVIDNTLKAIPSALRAAASRLPQTDIPPDVQSKARGVLDGYFQKMREAEASEFLFAMYELGKPVEVLRPGTFIDRFGREVVITEEDLRDLVRNFEAGTAGQDIPVDIQHEKAEAAGWVKRIWVEAGKLMADIDWNSLGKKLVGDGLYRYVSATLDLQNKVLKSVSLVNFPAVKGLKPVELSEGVYTLEEERTLDKLVEAARRLEATISKLVAQTNQQDVDEEEQQMGEKGKETHEVDLAELEAQLRAKVEAELKEQFEAQLREREENIRKEYELREKVETIVAELCEGDYGLGVQKDEVRDVLLAIQDDGLRQRVVNLLKAKVVEFKERGFAGEGELNNVTSPVEALEAKIRELMDKQNLDYAAAYLEATRRYPDLAAAYLMEEG